MQYISGSKKAFGQWCYHSLFGADFQSICKPISNLFLQITKFDPYFESNVTYDRL